MFDYKTNFDKFCKDNKLDLSILDLYYTKETEKFWKDNYIDVSIIKSSLKDKYGDVISDDSFGCDFTKIYYNDVNYIKFKSSSTVTMRDKLCENCSSYCQEGLFCLRLSRQGWMTSCQSNEKNGVIANDSVSICSLIERLKNAKPDNKSFNKMLEKNNVKYDN